MGQIDSHGQVQIQSMENRLHLLKELQSHMVRSLNTEEMGVKN